MVAAFQRRRQPIGGDQFDIVEPVLCPAFMATGSIAMTAQSAVLMLVRVTKPTTVTKLSCYTSAATANIDMSIADSGYNEVSPISAPVAAVAGGLTTGTLVAPFTYLPGYDYLHEIVLDATVTIVRGFTGVAVVNNAGVGAGTQRSLIKAIAQNTIPSVIASPTATAVALWVVGHN